MKANNFNYFNGKKLVTAQNGVLETLDGSRLTNIKISPLSMVNLSSTTFTPLNNTIYFYQLEGNEEFTFNAPENTNISINFRLYLVMPDPAISFTILSNIEWEEIPDFTTTGSLYMLVFEWNPVLAKWMGNIMWEPVEIDLSSIGPDVINNDSGDSSSLDVTSLRLSGFSNNTTYNGIFDLVDSTATGYDRVWYNSTKGRYIYSNQYGDGTVNPQINAWVMGTNTIGDASYVQSDMTQSYTNPWDITSWTYNGIVNNNTTMFDANGNALTSNAGWSDSTGVTGAVITISNATSNTSCNGTYRRTELSSTGNNRIWYCKDNNKYITHFEIASGDGYWVVGSEYAPIDTVSNGLYVSSNYTDTTNPWDVSSWKIEGTSTTDNMTLLI